jgi:predicted lysophospholipase L1 biosynthesis ABC-type transport system permease subunit
LSERVDYTTNKAISYRNLSYEPGSPNFVSLFYSGCITQYDSPYLFLFQIHYHTCEALREL